MKGNLGQVNSEFIQGWAFQKGTTEPVKLKIILDNEIIDSITADIQRVDILKKIDNSTLHCGFKYHFSKNINLSSHKELRVIFEKTGKDVVGSPFTINDQLENFSSKPTSIDYFFIHMPKTAGTSFRIEMLNLFGEEKLFPNNIDLKENNDQYPKGIELDGIFKRLERKVEILSGHYGLDTKNNIAPKSIGVTFLREPITRAISNLKHLQRHSVYFEGKTLMQIASLNGTANPEIRNRQCTMLWGGKDLKQKFNHENAFNNLKTFCFFGITEYYKASIELCNKLLNWNCKGDIFANQAQNKNQDKEVTAELLSYLKEQNKEDILLYNSALKLFKERCHENRISL
jgi:hypothetical protein